MKLKDFYLDIKSNNKIIIFLLSKQFQSKRKQDFFDIQNITS